MTRKVWVCTRGHLNPKKRRWEKAGPHWSYLCDRAYASDWQNCAGLRCSSYVYDIYITDEFKLGLQAAYRLSGCEAVREIVIQLAEENCVTEFLAEFGAPTNESARKQLTVRLFDVYRQWQSNRDLVFPQEWLVELLDRAAHQSDKIPQVAKDVLDGSHKPTGRSRGRIRKLTRDLLQSGVSERAIRRSGVRRSGL